jgi:hypothetical protein
MINVAYVTEAKLYWEFPNYNFNQKFEMHRTSSSLKVLHEQDSPFILMSYFIVIYNLGSAGAGT